MKVELLPVGGSFLRVLVLCILGAFTVEPRFAAQGIITTAAG